MKIISRCRIYIYNVLVKFYPWYYRTFYGMTIGEGAIISKKAVLDRSVNPKGIHIGANSFITSSVILAHDACRGIKVDTYIGDDYFIGIRAIILPGVRIGNQVVVGAGSIVTKDVPDHCIVAGNPAKIIRRGIHCKRGIIQSIENDKNI